MFPILFNVFEFSPGVHNVTVVVTDTAGEVITYLYTFTGETPSGKYGCVLHKQVPQHHHIEQCFQYECNPPCLSGKGTCHLYVCCARFLSMLTFPVQTL